MSLQRGMAGFVALDISNTRALKGCGISPFVPRKPIRAACPSRCLQSRPFAITSLFSSSLGSEFHMGFAQKSVQKVGLNTQTGSHFHEGIDHRCRQKVGLNIQAKAYDIDAGSLDGIVERTAGLVGDEDEEAKGARRIKIGIYFVTWWILNVVFNIYNKKVLNAFPYPWLTSTLCLAAGVSIMSVAWLTGIAEKPEVDADFWVALAPVALAHTVGHVAATISLSKVAVSFTHIIKSAEPAISVTVSSCLFGQHFSPGVYFSILPIIGGCALAAATELNFNTIGFVGAMVANFAFVFRNIFSKKGMVGKFVGGINYYGCLSILSLCFLTPVAFAVEGPKLWATGWDSAVATIGSHFVWWVAAQIVFYHLYNQVSYMSLNEISPLTFSIGNTMKGVTVIVSTIIIFNTQLRPINGIGAAIAIFGSFLYSQAQH